MLEDLTNAIRQNAEGPAEARGDSGSMRQHPLRDQIEADKYLTTKTAIANNKALLGLRLVRLMPPGAI